MNPPRYWEFWSFIAQVVMDEFHYFADPDRGAAWELPLWRFSRPGRSFQWWMLKIPPRRLDSREKNHEIEGKSSNCFVNGQSPNYWLTIVCMAHHLGFEHLLTGAFGRFTLKVGRLLFCWCPVPWVPMTSSMRPCRTVWVWKSDMEVWEMMSPP